MWIPLTIANLRQKLTAAEWAALSSAQLPEGVTGVQLAEEELGRTVMMVRGYVAARPSNTLGPVDTVPEELEDAALFIARHKVFSRMPGLKKLLDEARVREYEDGKQQLADVAAGRFAVVPPEEAAAQQAGGQSLVVVNKTVRQSTRAKWGGVL